MEMDGLDNAKCQKSRRRDMMGILESLMIMRQKMNSIHLLQLKDQKNMRGWKWGCSGWIFDFLEREIAPSL